MKWRLVSIGVSPSECLVQGVNAQEGHWDPDSHCAVIQGEGGAIVSSGLFSGIHAFHNLAIGVLRQRLRCRHTAFPTGVSEQMAKKREWGGVMVFEALQPLRFDNLHPAILCLPFLDSPIADPVPAA